MSKNNSQQNHMSRRDLRKTLKKLDDIKGQHTELISLYIPANYNINEMVSFLTTERSEAENIKSKQTRKHVQASLEKLQRRLREITHLPENGVAIFAGNVSEEEGKTDMELWEVVPPQEIDVRLYRCDKEFVTEPLWDMVREDKQYGLVSIDRNEMAIGVLKGKKVELLHTMESQVPGKQKAGGQSQQRFARIREGIYDTFLKTVTENIRTYFREPLNKGTLLGIIVGGSGHTREDLVDNYLDEELKQKVVANESTNYAGEDGIQELVQHIPAILQELDIAQETSLVNTFFEHLKKEDGLSVYGLDMTMEALEIGAVDTILISDKFSDDMIIYRCDSCHATQQVDGEGEYNCPRCGQQMILQEDEDLTEFLEEKAEEMGSQFRIISIDTEEGKRFRMMAGIGAILRFRIR